MKNKIKTKYSEVKKPHLVIIGFDEIVSNKYLSCFSDAIKNEEIDSYSVVDLETEKDNIERRMKNVSLKPENIFYLPDPRINGSWSEPKDFTPLLEMLIKQKGKIKIYIATEVKAHEGYLKYCIENGIDCLVEKPIMAPMIGDKFKPISISPTMEYLKACKPFCYDS